MALIACPECKNQVSDRATACPRCGNPMRPATATAAPVAEARAHVPEKSGGWLKWVLIVPFVLVGVAMCIGAVSDPNGKAATARLETQKQECATAMTSSIGHSTVGYADKAAYDARVRDKCAGLSIDGKPIGQ